MGKSLSANTTLNPRQERFCREYIKLGVASHAYAKAYRLADANSGTARVNSTRLKQMSAVRERIEELAAEAIQVSDLSLEVVVRGIAKEAATAKSSRDRLTAWSKLAQILGYEKNEIKVTHNQQGDERLIEELVRLGVSREQAMKELGYTAGTHKEISQDKRDSESLELSSHIRPESLN